MGISDIFRTGPNLLDVRAKYKAKLEARRQNFQEIKRKARLLVIEDIKEQFPFKFFEDEGYNIRHWPHVNSMTPLETGEYDVIVLDIAGVAPLYDSKLDGFAVLENIKKKNPSQIVIAFSGQSYDAEKNMFFRQADDVISKPIDAHRAKQAIDDLLLAQLNFDRHWEIIDPMLRKAGLSEKDILRTQAECLAAVVGEANVDIIKVLSPVVKNIEMAAKIGTLLHTFYRLFQY